MLDQQIVLQRNKRQLLKGGARHRRLLWLFGVLLLLGIGLWMALLYLDSMERPQRGAEPRSTLIKE